MNFQREYQGYESTNVVKDDFEKNHEDELNWRRNSQNGTKRDENSTSGEFGFNHSE